MTWKWYLFLPSFLPQKCWIHSRWYSMVCNKNFEASGPILDEWNVLFFLLFYNALDLNNQKILCLPSIYEFERTGTNLNHPSIHTWPERILRSKSNKQRTLQCILISGTHWFQKCNRWKYSPSSFWDCPACLLKFYRKQKRRKFYYEKS